MGENKITLAILGIVAVIIMLGTVFLSGGNLVGQAVGQSDQIQFDRGNIIIDSQSSYIRKQQSDGYLVLSGDVGWGRGAHVYLGGSQRDNHGDVRVRIGDNDVVRIRSGTTDQNKSGADIYFDAYSQYLRKVSNDGYMVLSGGSGWSQGGHIMLSGKNYSAHPSDILLRSDNKTVMRVGQGGVQVYNQPQHPFDVVTKEYVDNYINAALNHRQYEGLDPYIDMTYAYVCYRYDDNGNMSIVTDNKDCEVTKLVRPICSIRNPHLSFRSNFEGFSEYMESCFVDTQDFSGFGSQLPDHLKERLYYSGFYGGFMWNLFPSLTDLVRSFYVHKVDDYVVYLHAYIHEFEYRYGQNKPNRVDICEVCDCYSAGEAGLLPEPSCQYINDLRQDEEGYYILR